jgi:hypothetical protein
MEGKMKKLTSLKGIVALSILMIICMTFNGCLINHRSHTRQTSPERPIPQSELEKIEPGTTTKEWVIDRFGRPTNTRHLKDGAEILLYETRNRTKHEFSLFLIFSTESSEETQETISFEIKDGVIQRYWTD